MRTTPRCTGSLNRSERGAVGGLESLAFGVLILLSGTLVIINTWAAVDSRAALEAAAREYVRTYSEQSDAASAQRKAEDAARSMLAARGTPMSAMSIRLSTPNGFGPCAPVTVQMRTDIPNIRVPYLQPLGRSTIQVSAGELIDAHREMTPDSTYRSDATECFDD